MSIKQKTAIKIISIVVAVCVVAWFAITVIGNMADISKLQVQLDELQTQYDQQVEENEKIRAILESDDQDEYIEEKARENGYVKDGEIVYYDTSSDQ
jgi:cell division protein FtsB